MKSCVHVLANLCRLATTPPMGFNSWNQLGCGFNESKIRDVADALVSTGLLKSTVKLTWDVFCVSAGDSFMYTKRLLRIAMYCVVVLMLHSLM